MRKEPVLVTGATGYVGGRLIPQLLASGYRVRALGRSLSKIKALLAYEPSMNLDQIIRSVLDYQRGLLGPKG